MGPGRPKKCYQQLDAYIKQMEEAERSRRHITEARRIGRRFLHWIGEKDLTRVTSEELRAFVYQWPPGTTRRYYRTHVNRLLEINGNHVSRSMIWGRDPVDIRPNVKWLEPWQVAFLLRMDKDPEEEMILHLCLALSLRRIDVIRVRKMDIDRAHEFISFRSKHHVIRSVPFSPDTPQVLERYEAFRDEIREKGRGEDPEALLIGIDKTFHNHLTGLKETALDSRLARIRDRCPFHFTFHDMRRTWARQAWEAKVPVETISYILGHRDTKTTLRYIGVHGDHAREGMKKVYQSRQDLIQDFAKLQSYKIAEANE